MTYLKNLQDILKKLNYILTRKQKRWALLLLVVIAVGGLLETIGVSAIVPLIKAMMTPDELREGMPSFLRSFFARRDNAALIGWLAGGIIGLYIIKNLYLAWLSYFKAWYSCQIQQELSVRMMNSYIHRGYSFFLNTNTSHLLRGVGGDVSGVHSVINSLLKITIEGFTALLIIIYIFLQDALVASIVSGVGIACVLFLVFFFKNKMSRYGKIYRLYIGITNKNSLQVFEGIKEIMVMHREKHFTDEYEKSFGIMQKANVVHTVSSEVPANIIEASCIAALILALVIRMNQGVDVTEFIPKLGSFAVAAFRVLPSLGRISSAFNSMVYAIPSMNACYENVLDADRNRGSEKYLIESGQHLTFEKEISVEHVSFRYENTDKDVLSDISLKIKKGSSVALIGASGAGKTTLADIILGLLRPSDGKVLSDGHDIHQDPSSWASLIGFVPQSVYLIDDTIRNNVAFGIDQNKIDDTKVWKALEEAQLADFVHSLPNGLDNIVGDRGVRISGGQRQRIAIARAMYEDPEILVLDEATSALDSETEAAVMESINYLHGKKTLIIIAHRLTTIERCNYVYEVADGKLITRRKPV